MDIRVLGFVLLVIFFLHLQYHFAAGVIVKFANSDCTSLEGYDGVCIRRDQCTYAGGTASGTCASGIGRCCLFQGSCGESSSNNNTYFLNSNYPSTDITASQCIFTVTPISTSICQVRLDLLNFVLSQPDGNGNCIYDSMIISGATSSAPVLCGDNSGQHMYLTVDGTNSIQIIISTSSSVTLGRSWNIKVTQIACDCPTLAPVGCLQYYTDLSGTATSFNYGTGLNGNLLTFTNGTSVAGTRQIANENYGICVGMSPGYCSIQWSQGSDDISFTVSLDTAAVAVTTGLPADGFVGENCTTDFVVVPNSYYSNGTAVAGDRFCGNAFPTIVTQSKPFVLTVVTDENENSDAANRGFSLSFTQTACSNLATLYFTSK
ncbi:hypothetical protein JTB14_029626 [Gonioctena quinquepunctata]|nr:hypothetical protein JTB14_029626 [Gonioctena quinquepunctata]